MKKQEENKKNTRLDALEKVKGIFERKECIFESPKDSEVFFTAILNPRKPSEILIRAAEEYKSLLK